MSPELLYPTDFDSDGLPSRESDCYALGMTIYEVSGSLFSCNPLVFTHLQVLTGLVPFDHLWSSPAVACAILRGERPGKPLDASSLGLTDELWGLLQSCWSESASARPTAQQLFDYLRPASLTWVPPPTLCPATGVVSAPSSDIFGASGVSPSGFM